MQAVLKCTGALCIWLAGALLGMRKAKSYLQRAVMLEEMEQFLRCIERDLRYRREETGHLLQRAQTLCLGKALPFFLSPCASRALPQALEAALQALAQGTQGVLLTHDLQIFAQALQQLGTGQAEEETQRLAQAAETLNAAKGQAQKEAAVQSKLYRSLGLSGGAAVALLLL